jgi:hypothetical protein
MVTLVAEKVKLSFSHRQFIWVRDTISPPPELDKSGGKDNMFCAVQRITAGLTTTFITQKAKHH